MEGEQQREQCETEKLSVRQENIHVLILPLKWHYDLTLDLKFQCNDFVLTIKSEAQNLMKTVLIYTLQQIQIPEDSELDLWKLVLKKELSHAKTTITVHSPSRKKTKDTK